MQERALGTVHTPLQADLDQLSGAVLHDLDADVVVLFFPYKPGLAALGLSSPIWRGADGRIPLAALASLETVASNGSIRLTDARQHETFKSLKVVAEGQARGFLGVPIRNEEHGAFGSLCAVCAEPRKWLAVEEVYLRAVSRGVEHIILKEMYRLESADASKTLSEYDQIISAFSMVRADPTSIHDRSGRLVFANRALAQHIGDAELSGHSLKDAVTATPMTGQRVFLAKDGTLYRLTRHVTRAGYVVCHWKPETGALN